MNAIPKKFLLILMDLGLSLLFLVIILVAVLDFNSRLKHEEQQARQGGHGVTTPSMAGSLAQLQKQKESLTSQVDKGRAEMQEMWEKNTVLTAEIRKKNAEARKLLEDNVALLSQNASLLAQLNQEEERSKQSTHRPPILEAPLPGGAETASPAETPQAQALRQENADLIAHLAQTNDTLQRLQQQKAAQPQGTTAPVGGQRGQPLSSDLLDTQAVGEAEKRDGTKFWNSVISTFQEPAKTKPESSPLVEEATGIKPPSPPLVKVEKGMVGAGALDKITTAFQALPPAAPTTPGVTAPPSPAARATPAAAEPTAVRHDETTSTPAHSAPSALAAKEEAKEEAKETGTEKTGETGLWHTLMNTFQKSPKPAPSAVEVALPPPPASLPTPAATTTTPPAQAEKTAAVAAPETTLRRDTAADKGTRLATAPETRTRNPATPAATITTPPAQAEKTAAVITTPKETPQTDNTMDKGSHPVAAPGTRTATTGGMTPAKGGSTPATSAVGGAKTATETAAPIAPVEKGVTAAGTTPMATEVAKTGHDTPKEGMWEELLASFQGTHPAPAHPAATGSGQPVSPARGAPTTPTPAQPAETQVAARSPAPPVPPTVE